MTPVDFLAMWQPGQAWALAAIEPIDKEPRIVTRLCSDAASVDAFVAEYNGRWNLYYQPNLVHPERLGHKRASKDLMMGALCVHAEVDPPKGVATRAEIETWRAEWGERIEQWETTSIDSIPPPSLCLFSGSGYQFLWRLAEPVALMTDDEAPDLVARELIESRNRKLAQLLDGGDSSATDTARLLRLPGTWNVPPPRKIARGRTGPVLAAVIALHMDRLYAIDAFPAAAPSQAKPSAKPIAPAERVSIEQLHEMCSPDVVRGIVDGAAPGDDRSQCVSWVCRSLVEYGVDDPTIAAIIGDPAYKISAHQHDQADPQRAIERKIADARGKTTPNAIKIALQRKRCASSSATPPVETPAAAAAIPGPTAAAPAPMTADDLESCYRITRERLARSEDPAERTDHRYLGQLLAGKLSAPTADVALATAVALVRRAPAGASDELIAGRLVGVAGSRERAESLIAEARAVLVAPQVVVEPASSAGSDDDETKSQVTRLIEIVDDLEVELFRSPAGDAHATAPTVTDRVVTRMVTHAVDSGGFREWLDYVFYRATQGALTEASRQNVVNLLRARAVHDGAEHPVHVRLGEHGGRIYLDLADETSRAIEVDADGWRIVDHPPVKFRRPPGLLALPEPCRESEITLHKLWDFVLVREEDRPRVLAWLVGALNPRGPYYALVLVGRQGSIKSVAQRLLRHLIDPNEAPLRFEIGDGRDIMISATKSWIQSYDNQAPLTADASNALCCLSTGGAYATRTLHSNSDETILKAQRPIALNGIEEIVTAGDLLDRSIRVDCPVFTGKRRSESMVVADFERYRPALLALLLDAVSAAIRNLPDIRARDIPWPRMADAAQFAAAAEPAFGYKSGTILEALGVASSADDEVVIEASAVAQHIVALADFEGSASELLTAINRKVLSEKPDNWPRNAIKLSGELRRIAPALQRTRGIDLQFGRSKSGRTIVITKVEP